MSPRLVGPVRVVGAGLLGTSIGLALTARSLDVILDDASPAQLRLAMDYGAGRAARAGDVPQLIVVCVPPDVTSRVIAAELAAFPTATVCTLEVPQATAFGALLYLERGMAHKKVLPQPI